MRKKAKLSRQLLLPTAALLCWQLFSPAAGEAKVYQEPITGNKITDEAEYNITEEAGILTYTFGEGDNIQIIDRPATGRAEASGINLDNSNTSVAVNPAGPPLLILAQAQGGQGSGNESATASGVSSYNYTSINNSLMLGDNTSIKVLAQGGEAYSDSAYANAIATATANGVSSSNSNSSNNNSLTLGDNTSIQVLAQGGESEADAIDAEAEAEATAYGVFSSNRDSSNNSLTLGDNTSIQVLAQGGEADSGSAYAHAYAYAYASGVSSSNWDSSNNSLTLGGNTSIQVLAQGGEAVSDSANATAYAYANANGVYSENRSSSNENSLTLGSNTSITISATGGTATSQTATANATATASGVSSSNWDSINNSLTLGSNTSIKALAQGGEAYSDSAYANAFATATANGVSSSNYSSSINNSLTLGGNTSITISATGGTATSHTAAAAATAQAAGLYLSGSGGGLQIQGALSISASAQGGTATGSTADATANAYGLRVENNAELELEVPLEIYTFARAGLENGTLSQANAYALFAENNSSITLNQSGNSKLQLTGNILAGSSSQISLTLNTPDSYWRPFGQQPDSSLAADFGTGLFQLSGGAVLDLAAWNSENYDFSKARTLTVNGDGILGDGAVFRLNSDVQNKAADSVTFSSLNSATGTQYIQIAYDPYFDTITQAQSLSLEPSDRVLLVDLGGSFATGFSSLATSLDNPLYRLAVDPYLTYDQATGQAYLQGFSSRILGLSETPQLASDGQRALRSLWQTEGNSLMRRMGDLRLNQAENGIWLRQYGGESKAKSAYGRTIRQKYYGVQLGYDWSQQSSKGTSTSYSGLFLQNLESSPHYQSGSGKAKSSGFGLYHSKLWQDGQYLDIVLRASHLRNKYSLLDLSSNQINASYNTWAYGLSVEYGWRQDLKHNLFYEPQAEISLGRISSVNYQTSNNLDLKQGSVNTALARLGILLGKNLTGKTQGNYYLKASVLRDFGSAGSLQAGYLNAGQRLETGKKMGTSLELDLGTNLQLSKTSSFYLELSKSFGGNLKTDWQVNGGFRFSW